MTIPRVGDQQTQTDQQRKADDVQAMFASIAHRYDLLNRVLSLGVDRGWRRAAAQEALLLSPRHLLDVATGTADFALELKRRSPNTQVIGSDFVPQMLEIGRGKAAAQHLDIVLEEGDALNLPYPDASFDTVTCAFGFRNFSAGTGAVRQRLPVLLSAHPAAYRRTGERQCRGLHVPA